MTWRLPTDGDSRRRERGAGVAQQDQRRARRSHGIDLSSVCDAPIFNVDVGDAQALEQAQLGRRRCIAAVEVGLRVGFGLGRPTSVRSKPTPISKSCVLSPSNRPTPNRRAWRRVSKRRCDALIANADVINIDSRQTAKRVALARQLPALLSTLQSATQRLQLAQFQRDVIYARPSLSRFDRGFFAQRSRAIDSTRCDRAISS